MPIDPTEYSSPIDVFENGISSISIGLANLAIKDYNEINVYPYNA